MPYNPESGDDLPIDSNPHDGSEYSGSISVNNDLPEAHAELQDSEQGLAQDDQDEWADEMEIDYSEDQYLDEDTNQDGEGQTETHLADVQHSHISGHIHHAQSPPLKAAKVAVLIQSSPRKGEYSVLPQHLLDEEEDVLVTSDITPNRKKASQGPSPQNPALVHQPPLSTPFSLPTKSPQALITPQPKKRGRPFGWKPGSGPYSSHASGIRGAAPSARPPKPPKPPKTPGEMKRRGRPPKAPAQTARELYLKTNPRFPVFPCEWQGCPAQLQNYETLRAHVLAVHGRSGVCEWGDCASKHGGEPLRLAEPKAFEDHTEKMHLLAVLWSRGDGPKNTSIPAPWTARSAESKNPPFKEKNQVKSAWLFNDKGDQVTPDATAVRLESDDDRRKRRAQLEKLLTQRDNNAAPEPTYTKEDWDVITDALNDKKRRQKMFRDYRSQVLGINGQPARYGPEWKGLMVSDSIGDEG